MELFKVMNLPDGHLLQNGKYRLTHVVGQGGFGITYRGVWYTEVKGSLGTVKTEVPICVKEYFFKDYCYREPGSQAVKVHSETGKVLFNKFKEKTDQRGKDPIGSSPSLYRKRVGGFRGKQYGLYCHGVYFRLLAKIYA